MHRFAFSFLPFWISLPAMSQVNFLGLSPSTEALGQSEAIVSCSYGSDSLFYNPANLAWQGLHLRLLGVEATLDNRSVKLIEQFSNRQLDEGTLIEAIDSLDAQGRSSLGLTGRLVDISMPFVALSTFATLRVDYTRPEGQRLLTLAKDLGAIFGFAIKLSPRIALGISHYRMIRARFNLNPTDEQLDGAIAAIEQNNEDEIPFSQFTNTEYGYGEGYNAGISFRFWDKNISGIGLSVLNIGAVDFKETSDIQISETKEIEAEVLEFTEKYQLERNTPPGLAQMVNVGLTLGLGQEESFFHSRVSIEGHDIMGHQLQNREAVSMSLGVQIPQGLTMLTAVPILATDEILIHAGFLGAQIFAGARHGEHVTGGGKMSFHFGGDLKVSILRLDFSYFKAQAIENDSSLELQGIKALLSGTFLF